MRDLFYINGLGLHYGEQGLGAFAAERHGRGRSTFSDAPPLKDVLPGLNLRRASAASRMALSAAAQALAMAEQPLPLPDETAGRTGLYIGSAYGAAGSSFAFMNSILDGGAQLASPAHFSHSVNNAFCGFVSMSLNIQGPSCTVCQFGLSFAGGLQAGLCALEAGEIDMALVGAVEEADKNMELVAQRAQASDPAPQRDCAVFFAISRRAEASLAGVCMPAWLRGASLNSDLNSGLETDGELASASSEAMLWSTEPAAQALDVAAAVTGFRNGVAKAGAEAGDAGKRAEAGSQIHVLCRKADGWRGIAADITLSRLRDGQA